MIERRYYAQGLLGTLVRAGRSSMLSLLFVAGLTGCRHKVRWVPPQGAMVPVEVQIVPEADDLPLIAEVPQPDLEPPIVSDESPKKPARRRPAPVKETPPVQVASAEPAAALAIGELSSGGDTTPQSQQQAKDLIADIMKRLKALPGKTASQQKALVRQVSSFLKQAQKALDSGDAEGAKNLATKAKLLMDDVEKK